MVPPWVELRSACYRHAALYVRGLTHVFHYARCFIYTVTTKTCLQHTSLTGVILFSEIVDLIVTYHE